MTAARLVGLIGGCAQPILLPENLSDKRIGTAINGKLEPKDDGGVVTLNGCENKGLQSIIARAFGAVIYGINDEI